MAKQENGGAFVNPCCFGTRAGLTPDMSCLPYSISTNQIKTFINLKIKNAVMEFNTQMQQKAAAEGTTYVPVPLIEVEVKSISVQKTRGKNNYVPIAVFIPMELVSNAGNRQKSNANELAIFNEKQEDHTVNVAPPVYKVIKDYMYSKEDINGFKKTMDEAGIGLSRQGVFNITKMFRIKVMSSGKKNKGIKKAAVVIDPFRIIHDMLMSTDPSFNKPFRVVLKETIKKSDSDYNYKVIRKDASNNKKNNGDEFMKSFMSNINKSGF